MMKIIKLEAENFKRLIAVEIEPKTNVVKISGKNKQGKTSCLDSITSLIGGDKFLPENPIHEGTDRSVLYADLGELEVRKIITKKSTRLEVKRKGSNKPESSPQKILDNLFGKFMFDPKEFSELPAKEQYNQLLSMVDLPDITEFLLNLGKLSKDEELASDIRQVVKSGDPMSQMSLVRKKIYDSRTLLNRESSRLQGAIDEIIIPTEMHGARNLEDLMTEKERMLDSKAERDKKIDLVDNKKLEINRIAQDISDTKSEIEDLKARLSEKKNKLEQLQADMFEAKVDLETESKELSATQEIDFILINQEIEEAKNNSAVLVEREKKIRLEKEKHVTTKNSELFSSLLKKIDDKKIEILKKVKFPVEGLTLGDACLLYKDQPFSQASDSEQLVVSCLISIKEDPELKVIRIRDGSLMDSESWSVIEEIADKFDFQIWVEVVADGPGCGLYIEDGLIK